MTFPTSSLSLCPNEDSRCTLLKPTVRYLQNCTTPKAISEPLFEVRAIIVALSSSTASVALGKNPRHGQCTDAHVASCYSPYRRDSLDLGIASAAFRPILLFTHTFENELNSGSRLSTKPLCIWKPSDIMAAQTEKTFNTAV